MTARYESKNARHLLNKTIKVIRKDWKQFLRIFFRYTMLVFDRLFGFFVHHFRRKKIFLFLGREYKYFYHWYNQTWSNERSVEIPIFYSILLENRHKNILEVGNVMSHYFTVDYDILDKYDGVHSVIKCDVVEYHPDFKYDLIISISTLEHVGRDETPFDPAKSLQAIAHLHSLLKPNGRLIFSIPVGYNEVLDSALFSNSLPGIPVHAIHAMHRVSRHNYWEETSLEKVRGYRYGHPYNAANAILIVDITKTDTNHKP